MNVATLTGTSAAAQKVSDLDRAKIVVRVKTAGVSGAKFAG